MTKRDAVNLVRAAETLKNEARKKRLQEEEEYRQQNERDAIAGFEITFRDWVAIQK